MDAGNCRSSTFFAAACALSSRSNRPTHTYMEFVITESEPGDFVEFAAPAREFLRTGPVSMRGKMSGAAGLAGSGAGAFVWATIFATGGLVPSTTGATGGGAGGGAGYSYAKSGGFGGAAADGGESLFAACTTPRQCSALSTAITSNAPSKIHRNGDVRRGVGCGMAAAAARGTPVEACVKFVVVVPSMRGGGITGAPERRLDSRSAMDGKRLAGSFSRHFRIARSVPTGIFGSISCGGGGSSRICFSAMAMELSALNAGTPVNIS